MSTSTGATTTVWTPEAVRQLGMTTDVATAGAILGIGRSRAYELAESGQFPVNVLRIGRRYLVPTSAAGSARFTNGRPHRVGTRTPASALQTDQRLRLWAPTLLDSSVVSGLDSTTPPVLLLG